MSSIPIELEDDVADTLRQLAEDERRSESEIVREALAAFMQARRPRPKGIGQYRSGRPDIAENARTILRDDAAEGRWP